MIQSMTAFASLTGAAGTATWHWDMRSVNARGLDLRMRLPEGIAGLEAGLRKAVMARLARGNVTIGLRLTRDDAGKTMMLDTAQLDRVLRALDQVQERALDMGVTLGQPNAADVLAQRGVIVQEAGDTGESDALAAPLLAQFDQLLADFVAMRATEGAALQRVMCHQLDRIAALVTDAARLAEERLPEMRETLNTALERVLADLAPAGVDPARLAQELALIAVKQDVTEEIDRLQAHVEAARALLDEGGPVGRRLDFLTQEFNREANTLCAKAQSQALTTVGLGLKAVIDQMREQVQNVE